MSAWARRRANVKLFDAGLALGRLLGELAGKTGCYPCALSVKLLPRCKGAGEPGLAAARRRGPARRVASSEVRSGALRQRTARLLLCREVTASKNSVKKHGLRQSCTSRERRRESLKNESFTSRSDRESPVSAHREVLQRTKRSSETRFWQEIQAPWRQLCAHYAVNARFELITQRP